MDTVIQFTPAQLIGIAGAIITISTAIGVLINLINTAKFKAYAFDVRR